MVLSRLRKCALGLGLLVALAAVPGRGYAENYRCFAETHYCISGRILEYWEAHGGLPVFGYPIGAAGQELNRDTGQVYETQWFERTRLEVHPENQTPYDVLLGRIGDDALLRAGIRSASLPQASGPREGCLWFEQTRHNVCNQGNGIGFKSYWQGHGLEFDGRPGKSFEESLALFGLPLSEPRMETNSSGDTVLTQWFERARFEWHPDKPDVYKVLLGRLGGEVQAYDQRAQQVLETLNCVRSRAGLPDYPSFDPTLSQQAARVLAGDTPGPGVYPLLAHRTLRFEGFPIHSTCSVGGVSLLDLQEQLTSTSGLGLAMGRDDAQGRTPIVLLGR